MNWKLWEHLGNKLGKFQPSEDGNTAPGACLSCGVRCQPLRYTAAHGTPATCRRLCAAALLLPIPVRSPSDPNTHTHTHTLLVSIKTRTFCSCIPGGQMLNTHLLTKWKDVFLANKISKNTMVVLLGHWRRAGNHKELSGMEECDPNLGGFAPAE